MHRFHCPMLSELPADAAISAASPGPTVYLDAQESRHARKVLRLEIGQIIGLLDGRGRRARGVLVEWCEGLGAAVRIEAMECVPAPRPAIDLAAAVPKGGHADEMLAALSQLGVARLIPLRTRRSIVDPRPTKIERFNRAAMESAKQCGRAHLMEVAEPASLSEALAQGHDLTLIAAPPRDGDAPDAARTDLDARLRAAARVMILIGPEGGWAPEELAQAAQAGCVSWALGPHVMRIETAAAAAAAIARYATFSPRDHAPSVWDGF